MSKKTIALILCMVMALTMGLGGTLAYLTDRDAETNVFTIGNVDIELEEDFEQGAELIPGVDIEKKPVITNTGSTDAWVWLTFSLPAEMDQLIQGTEDGSSENVIHWNPLGATADGYVTEERVKNAIAAGHLPEGITAEEILASNMTWNVFNSIATGENCYAEEINGKNYNTYVLLYNKALEPGETTLPSIYKVFLDSRVDIDPDGNMAFVKNGEVTKLDWNINDDGAPIIYAAAYAVQKEGFETVQDAYAAYSEQWGENGGVEYAQGVEVTNSEEFVKALSADEPQIIVELTKDVTVDVTAWQNKPVGGDSTKEIVIFGNGNTITFNQTNSDWNNIATSNGAKLVIRDANITNSGHNDGPWNRHDLNFACDVELYNVNSDKAIALKAGGILKDVTINDANTSDTYAIWIQPNGQTVELDGCTIDMLDCTDGRGISINDQYFKGGDNAGKDASEQLPVTLMITDTVFKTEEKAAIVVKTRVGSTIVLDNVDISEVAADSTYPVWVDEDRAEQADLVTVTGGDKIIEP